MQKKKYLLVTALLWSRQKPVKIMVMTIIMIITMPKRTKIIENQKKLVPGRMAAMVARFLKSKMESSRGRLPSCQS